MAESRSKRVVIAGGGTAGWIAAAALVRQLGPLLDITLVESDAIGTVGVGEATIPTHRTFHHLLGIDERAFMRETQASFKLGIAFENWAREGDRYFHSFGQLGKSTWMADFHHLWLEARAAGLAGELGAYCLELQAAEAEKFATGPNARINYAYHLDASRYAGFLRKIAEDQGVKRVEGRIADVETEGVRTDGARGDITALRLDDGTRIAGDFFIDCTGFRALLIGDALGTGFEDWSHWLPMDRAIALQTGSTGPARPYTRSIAHGAGWQWQIPLQHRVGNGLVYCSAHLDDGAAQDLLLENVSGAPLTEPRVIRFRTGRREQVWTRNCLALGLSSGFLEPLESTSIHLIQAGVMRLIQMFPFGDQCDALRDRYNALSRDELERIRDFIILHYKATQRDETAFWRQCRDMSIPDSLAARIELFRQSGMAYQDGADLFRVDSWLQVLLGQRIEPQSHHAMGRLMTYDQMRQALDAVKSNIAASVSKLPQHQDFLDQYCAAETA
ncbi:tryptophan halogenase [Maricaulis sp. W15]|uniref:Tryptophan halogenase n=1 Tax=Maricaulis maris TaxID=74318 RepID=A0A495D551_9PROT|nr:MULTISPECIES: tryptophan halogenase family protein [Maricaulis]OLF75267.1 tryptophan halogenase [Maricaulis sp. W15]RKQ96549.1 tryptophan halogenase [Maricaulis maris]